MAGIVFDNGTWRITEVNGIYNLYELVNGFVWLYHFSSAESSDVMEMIK